MSDKRPKCVICDKPADSPNALLCKKHWKSAQRQTMRLNADELDEQTGMVWLRSDA